MDEWVCDAVVTPTTKGTRLEATSVEVDWSPYGVGVGRPEGGFGEPVRLRVCLPGKTLSYSNKYITMILIYRIVWVIDKTDRGGSVTGKSMNSPHG